ncbi:uncharacterized protein LOC136073174 isoform X2 [Hydra vulgaris]|uniref:uncharacterized protein LOC136073174 isoform X2 n=1 Tax=Hydra vulgaris TaxID=6087 RepID=UPI0032EA5B18
MDNKKYKEILLKVAINLSDKDFKAIKFYYSTQINYGQLEKIETPIELIQTLEHCMLLGIDNYDAFVKVLGIIGRNDLVKYFSGSLNSSEFTNNLYVRKDISVICAALKSYYLTNYGKTTEIQPPLKSPANVDLMHKFVDLCIVDAVNTQIDAVYSVERREFLEKQLSYTPIPYNEIFMKEKSVTLISGIAGIGKTWLLRKCLLDWSNGLIWENVKLVFYLECRRLNQYQNISNINELLNVFYKDIINDFDIINHPALFIIDGLDEFKYLNELINCSSSTVLAKKIRPRIVYLCIQYVHCSVGAFLGISPSRFACVIG